MGVFHTEEKTINQRLKVLKLVDALGNVSEACRRCKISRNTFYNHKRRFEKHGLEGLKNLSRTPHSFPRLTPPRVVNKILNLARKQPKWGCIMISKTLKSKGISISGVTTQKILTKNGLRSRQERLSLSKQRETKNC